MEATRDITVPNVNLAKFMIERMLAYGNSVALIDAESKKQYTYKDLISRIQKLAAGLRVVGMQRRDVLCALTYNTIEYPVLWYATNMLGGTFTTASPFYTDDELARKLLDCNVKFLVTIPALASRITNLIYRLKLTTPSFSKPNFLSKLIVLGEKEGYISYESLFLHGLVENAVNVSPTSETAILLSSSGTSGLPKHVQLSHSNISVNIIQIDQCLKLRPGETTILTLPTFHHFGVHGGLGANLYYGVRIVVMETWDTLKYMSLVQQYQASVVEIVPAMITSILKHPDRFKFNFSSVRVLLTASAPLGIKVSEEIKTLFNLKYISQAYGMTETGYNSGNDEAHYKPGSCGVRPSGVDLKIIDQDENELPRLQPGEIAVRGPSVTIGYLNNPSANKSTLTNNGYFLTGDVGYIDEDGFLFVVDRLKELIKYKGLQVPPAYLEDILVKHGEVLEAAVIGIPDEDAGELPKAFVVRRKGSNLTKEEIIQYVSDHVSSHMRLRGGVEFLDEIPRNPSGKILRRVLKNKEIRTSKL